MSLSMLMVGRIISSIETDLGIESPDDHDQTLSIVVRKNGDYYGVDVKSDSAAEIFDRLVKLSEVNGSFDNIRVWGESIAFPVQEWEEGIGIVID